MNSFLLLFDNLNDVVVFDLTELVDKNVKSASLSVDKSFYEDSFIRRNFLVNSSKISSSSVFEVSSTSLKNHIIFTFKMIKPLKKNLNLNLGTIHCTTSSKEFSLELKVQFSKQESYISELYKNSANIINSKLSSFMLLRTNPKLTGNIKLVVDTDYNLYLDTFKVSDILSKKEYRHQLIPSAGNYPKDVYNVFHTLPQGSLYKLPEGIYDPHSTHSDFDSQFETIYEYGAETNSDLLYAENMKILAPLWVNQNLPDYFVIFKVDSPFNESTYNSNVLNSQETFSNLLKNGKIIQYYDLRKTTSIGQYLNGYRDRLKDTNDCAYLQFVEQETSKENLNNIDYITQGTNSWNGISIKKGILTKMVETSWFSNQILNQLERTQEDFNMFLVNGFERNNILIPNILNLEFMFNDSESETYSMHRYFGLYLKENDILNYKYLLKDYSSKNLKIRKIDSTGNPVDENNVLSLLRNAEYSDRIVFATTSKTEKRIQSEEDLNTFLHQNVLDVAETNLCSSKAREIKTDSFSNGSFISMKLNAPMHYGEHLRVVYKKRSKDEKNKVFEIIASNDIRLKATNNNIFPYIQTNERKFDNSDMSYGAYFRSQEEITKKKFPYSDKDSWDNNVYHFSDLRIDNGERENILDYSLLNNSEIATSFKLKDRNVLNSSDNIPYDKEVDDRYFNNYNKGKASEVVESKYPYFSNLVFNESEVAFSEFPEVYRLSFYSQDLEDETKPASIEEQIKRIKACIEKFNQDFYVASSSEDTLSIVSLRNEVYLQHISATDSIKDLEESSTLFSENQEQENISYFTSKLRTYFHWLNYKTLSYSTDTIPFALLDFELLKWRKSSIVKFADFEKDKTYYELDKDIIAGNSAEDIMIAPLYREPNKFAEVLNFGLKSGYAEVFDETSGSVINNLVLDVLKTNLVYSPFSAGKVLLFSNRRLNLNDNTLKLYRPMQCNVALMGMLSIKDFDSRVNFNEEKNFKSLNSFTLNRNSVIPKSEIGNVFKEFVVYKLKSGKINELSVNPGETFMFSGTSFVLGTTSVVDVPSQLTIEEDCIIENTNNKNLSTYDFSIKNSKMNEVNFFKDSNASNDLSIPLVVPVNCRWESNGVYYDHNNELDVKQLNANLWKKSKNNGFFIEKDFGIPSNNSQYIENDINDSVSIDSSTYTFRELIESSAVSNPIHEFLVNNNKVDTAIGYYNKYVNTLEFIYYGIKFTIQMTSSEYVNTIRLNEYNNYEVIVLLDYDSSKKNEILVSTSENLILYIVHSFKNVKSFNNNIVFDTDKGLSSDLSYYFEDAPYHLDYSRCFGTKKKLVIPKSNASKLQDASIFIENDFHNDDPNYIGSEDHFYGYFNTSDYSEDSSYGFINFNFLGRNSNSPLMSGNSSETRNSDSLEESIDLNSNDTISESYLIKKANIVSSDSQIIEDLIENLNKNSLNTEIFIIKDDSVIEHIDVSESYSPIQISATQCKNIKFNFGYFEPKTYNVVEFETRDDKKVSSLLGMNLLLSNTKVHSIKDVENYYGLKIDSNKRLPEYSKNFFSTTRNIFSSNWDKNYYRNYDGSESNFTLLDGYIPGIEDKSFFGSKCLVLPKETFFVVNDYSSSNDTILKQSFTNDSYLGSSENNTQNKRDNTKSLEVQINVSKAILNFFKKQQPNFVKNWDKFGYSTDVAITNYINQTLSNYFSINDNIEVTVWQKEFSSQQQEIVLKEIPEDFEQNWSLVKDHYRTSFENNNGDLNLSLKFNEIKQSTSLQLYIQLKINRR